MEKGIGAAALILAVIAIFVPLHWGFYVSGAAICLAVASALYGDKSFAIATPVVAAANLFLLSPIMFGWLKHESQLLVAAVVILSAPVIVVGIKSALAAPSKAQTEEASPPKRQEFEVSEHSVRNNGESGKPVPTQAIRAAAKVDADIDIETKWQTLVKYDEELAAAQARVSRFGPDKVARLAAEFLQMSDKSRLAPLVDRIVQESESEFLCSSAPNADKWAILVSSSREIREADDEIRPLGEVYRQQLIDDFLAIRDNAYLRNIVQKIKDAAQEDAYKNYKRPKVIERGKYKGHEWTEYSNGIVVANTALGSTPFVDMEQMKKTIKLIEGAGSRLAQWASQVPSCHDQGCTKDIKWRSFDNGVVEAQFAEGLTYFSDVKAFEKHLHLPDINKQ